MNPQNMKSKLILVAKLALLLLFTLMWFILIQAEYEILTKPELRNDVPIIKGLAAVYFFGFVLLIISVIIVFLIRSIRRPRKQSQ